MQARNYEFQSDFVRKYFYGGKAEGLTEGKAAGKAEVLLKLLRRKFTAVDAAYEARVLACSDVDQLDAWAERVLDADSVAAVFAA